MIRETVRCRKEDSSAGHSATYDGRRRLSCRRSSACHAGRRVGVVVGRFTFLRLFADDFLPFALSTPETRASWGCADDDAGISKQVGR